jgi:hypothetical protein
MVMYTIGLNGKLFVIENVPARVSNETVEKIHAIINGGQMPARSVSDDIFDFAT